eukprot:scaffold8942_cov99-Isochrysis_galbana.AAC.1
MHEVWAHGPRPAPCASALENDRTTSATATWASMNPLPAWPLYRPNPAAGASNRPHSSGPPWPFQGQTGHLRAGLGVSPPPNPRPPPAAALHPPRAPPHPRPPAAPLRRIHARAPPPLRHRAPRMLPPTRRRCRHRSWAPSSSSGAARRAGRGRAASNAARRVGPWSGEPWRRRGARAR